MNNDDQAICDAEASVLGAAFLAVDAFYRADLRPEDFNNPRARVVWEAMSAVAGRGEAIDPRVIEAELARAGRWDGVGGYSTLSSYISAVPTADNVEHYAAIVRRAAHKRRQVLALSAALAMARESSVEPEDVEGAVYQSLAAAGARPGKHARTATDLMRAEYGALGARMDVQPGTVGPRVPTGLRDLDFVLGGGLDHGTTHVVAGRTSDGKTALMCGMATAAARAGWPVYLASLEDTSAAVARRLLASSSGVNITSIRTGELDRDRLVRLGDAAERAGDLEALLVDDTRGLRSDRLEARLRQWQAAYDPAHRGLVVFLDYAQRVRLHGRDGDRRDQLLADAVAWFDDACASLGICGILGWQTNREGVRDGDRPRLHHLGGSDAASWAAKTVLAPHHGRNENGGISSSIVWVLKQKEGPRDVPVAVTFDAHTATFRDRNAWGMP